MSVEVKSVPVPTAIRELIASNNQLLKNYQQELTTKVQISNREMMMLLGLNPEDGWMLDTNTMTYIKETPVSQVTLEQPTTE